MVLQRSIFRRGRNAFPNSDKLILSGLRSRSPRRAFRLIAFGVALTVLYAWFPVPGEQVTGVMRVIDGDTLDMQGKRFRLYGIDAPESSQICVKNGREYACGKESAKALADIIGQNPVTCEAKDNDPYGRIVAVCSAGGVDLNRWMVAHGQALAYRHYSVLYLWDEIKARGDRAGLWGGTFENPWDYRHRK